MGFKFHLIWFKNLKFEILDTSQLLHVIFLQTLNFFTIKCITRFQYFENIRKHCQVEKQKRRMW
jgi:hypothetical protein